MTIYKLKKNLEELPLERLENLISHPVELWLDAAGQVDYWANWGKG